MDIKQIYREETNLEPHFDVGLDCITCFSIEYVKWLEAKLTLTHDVKSDSELLLRDCSTCGTYDIADCNNCTDFDNWRKKQ
jgi:hypothetical protein